MIGLRLDHREEPLRPMRAPYARQDAPPDRLLRLSAKPEPGFAHGFLEPPLGHSFYTGDTCDGPALKTRARPRSPTTRALTADRARARIGPDVARLERVPRACPGGRGTRPARASGPAPGRGDRRRPSTDRMAAVVAGSVQGRAGVGEWKGLGALVIEYGLISISIWVAALVVGLWRHPRVGLCRGGGHLRGDRRGLGDRSLGRIPIQTLSYGRAGRFAISSVRWSRREHRRRLATGSRPARPPPDGVSHRGTAPPKTTTPVKETHSGRKSRVDCWSIRAHAG